MEAEGRQGTDLKAVREPYRDQDSTCGDLGALETGYQHCSLSIGLLHFSLASRPRPHVPLGPRLASSAEVWPEEARLIGRRVVSRETWRNARRSVRVAR